MVNIIEIFNIEILNIRQDDFLKSLDKGVLITPNVDHLVKLQKDKEFTRYITKPIG
jgi:UDP-N-acetyl-D-mannosaminuronic acid transferase (WecB/TagA/CpsF family)